jgi:thiosulfate/3-mercaptopyruvate sulfurtransferase
MKILLRGVAALAASVGFNLASAGVLPGPLVDPQWLAANLDKVQVVDVRSNVKSYTAQPEFDTDAKTGKKTLTEVGGHIAGSRLIDMKTMRTDRQFGDLKVKYMIPERADFEKAVRAAGVDAGKPIVLVPVGSDAADVDDALRVYWQFKVYGEDDIAVLNGGTAAWLLDGRAVSADAAATTAGTWSAKGDRSQRYFADSDDVAKAIASKSATLVDSRDGRQYHGLVKRDYVGAYGHLEGAKLYPTDLMFKTGGGAVTFMSPATYRGLLTAQGIDPAAPAITYCNSGHLSSGPWFVMSELLGNAQARLYDGSLHQWTLEKRPVVGGVALN